MWFLCGAVMIMGLTACSAEKKPVVVSSVSEEASVDPSNDEKNRDVGIDINTASENLSEAWADVPEQVKDQLKVYLSRSGVLNTSGKYIVENILLSGEDTYCILLKDGDPNYSADFESKRLLFEVKRESDQWRTEKPVCTEGADWTDLIEEIVRLFTEYRRYPDRHQIEKAAGLLEDPGILAKCFPEAGSREESWKAVWDSLKISSKEQPKDDLIAKEMIRVYGAASPEIRLDRPWFIIRIQRTGEINEAEFPNIKWFFDNDGIEGDICVVCSYNDDGELMMSADPLAFPVKVSKP